MTPTVPSSHRPAPILWLMSVTLMLLSVMSYLDRQIMALLVPDLHRDLGLSDVQIGALLGPAFIVTYLIALLLAAPVVDRFNKVAVIVAGAVLWAATTFASAYAKTYGELIALRSCLAIGEAILGPAAVALIGDYFQERGSRLKASAIFLMGSTIGASGSAAFGAMAVQLALMLSGAFAVVGLAASWRLALVLVSLPTFGLALALLVLGRKASRRPAAADGAPADLGGERLGAYLRRHGGRYLTLIVGVNLMIMVQVGALIWGPAFLMRRFHVSQVGAGYLFGAVALASGLGGVAGGALAIQRWAPDYSFAQFRRLALILTPVGMAGLACAMLAPSLTLSLILLAPALLLLGAAVTLPMQFIQSNAPPHLKGRIAVGFYLILYFLTSGCGPILPPAVARLLPAGDNQLGLAIALLAVATTVVATPLLMVGRDPPVSALSLPA